MINMDMFNYAIILEFQFRYIYFGFNEDGVDLGGIGDPRQWQSFVSGEQPWLRPPHEFILVHNAEEAALLPNHIIAAWPREFETQRALAEFFRLTTTNEGTILHGIHSKDAVNINDFGLSSFPLTTTDLVDNWEGVIRLLRAANPSMFRNFQID